MREIFDNIKVGDIVCLYELNHNCTMSIDFESRIKEVVVEKVGKKYIFIKKRQKFDKTDIINDYYIVEPEYFNGMLFINKEKALEYFKKSNYLYKIKLYFEDTHLELSMENIEKIFEIIDNKDLIGEQNGNRC